ncbi:tyrosine-type recombinase/integrase [Flavobacteriaceae bacterium]|nr:tyrosine-type recombinase/integrase [Flavobacteriaceae bacterium]
MKNLELKNIKFIKALEGFKVRLSIQGASKDQQYIKPNYVIEFLYFMEQVGKKSLKSINQKLVNKYFEYLRTRPAQTKDGCLSEGSINKHRESLLRFIEFVNDIEKGQSGIRIKHYKPNKKLKQILLESDVKAMFDSCDYTSVGIRDKAIFSLLYGCGLRRGELLSLDVQDIDLNKGRVHLDKTKTKYARDVPMTSAVQKNIEDYLFNVRNMMLDVNSSVNSFLITVKGTAMKKSTIAKVMTRLNNRLNINKKVTCHMLRHSIGTHLHRFMKLEDVATFLGHRNLDSTMIYTHLKQQYYGN